MAYTKTSSIEIESLTDFYKKAQQELMKQHSIKYKQQKEQQFIDSVSKQIDQYKHDQLEAMIDHLDGSSSRPSVTPTSANNTILEKLKDFRSII